VAAILGAGLAHGHRTAPGRLPFRERRVDEKPSRSCRGRIRPKCVQWRRSRDRAVAVCFVQREYLGISTSAVIRADRWARRLPYSSQVVFTGGLRFGAWITMVLLDTPLLASNHEIEKVPSSLFAQAVSFRVAVVEFVATHSRCWG